MRTPSLLGGVSAALALLTAGAHAQSVEFLTGKGYVSDLDFTGTAALLNGGPSGAAVWSLAPFSVVTPLPTNKGAEGISVGGVIVGGTIDQAGLMVAAQYSSLSGTWTPLGSFGGTCGTTDGRTQDISFNGEVMTGLAYQGSCNFLPFKWSTGAGFVELPRSEFNARGEGNDVSFDGSYVAGYEDTAALPKQAVVWNPDNTLKPLATDPTKQSEAMAVDNSGTIVVGFQTPDAMLWIDGQPAVALPHIPGGGSAVANAISADGHVIVGQEQVPTSPFPPFPNHATLYRTDVGMLDLNTLAQELGFDTTGFEMASALGISGDGRVVAGAAKDLNSGFPGAGEAFVLRLPDAWLRSSVGDVSLSAGGAVPYTLNAGVERAGAFYVLVGSASGTTPGIAVDGVTLPLNVDAYTNYLLTQPSALFTGSIGILDGAGSAAATMNVPAGSPPSLAGFTVHHAYAVISTTSFQVVEASNARALNLLL
ncbi:MAG TPA: hypothetical protein VJP77_08575 [Planctomycetota bacterium]|nr:hypothetical protein [Planctomycetota bacterium]